MPSHPIHALIDLWRQRQPRHAHGGWWALSGFHYQLLISIQQTIDAYRPGQSALQLNETLSDHLRFEANSTHWLCIQVKRRLDRRTLSAALAELWLIHTLALSDAPELARDAHYEVCAEQIDGQPDAHLPDWQPDHPAEPAQLADFLQRVQVVHRHNVRAAILTQLVSQPIYAATPLTLLESWLAHGLSIERTRDGEALAERIYNDLHQAPKTHGALPPGIMMWRPHFRPPADVVCDDREDSVLTGQQPTPQDLADGCFFTRPLYATLADKAERWIHQQASQSRSLPAVFWLGGRSGCGKSVALLHVLGQLHQAGFDRILWLGNSVSLLPDAVALARALHSEDSREAPVIIALDDPFLLPNSQALAAWQAAVDALQDLVAQRRGDELPVFLCCGPSEQAIRFEEQMAGQLRVSRHDLPIESPAELADMRHWFTRRTSRPAPHYAEHDENLLLVQLFFEWRHAEPLKEFARHFRQRLKAWDDSGELEKHVAQILAANRLYIGYCPAALERLDAVLRDRLSALTQDQHLRVLSDARPLSAAAGQARRPGVWLAHPHLVDAIYQTWFPPGQHAATRRQHLVNAALDWLQHAAEDSQRNTVLWAIAYSQTRPSLPYAGRLSAADAAQTLADIHHQRPDLTRGSLSALAPWVAAETELPALVAQLPNRPRAQAIHRLNAIQQDEPGLGLVCRLLATPPANAHDAAATDTVLALLRRLDARQWPKWQSLAQYCLTLTHDPALALSLANYYAQRPSEHPGLWLEHCLQSAGEAALPAVQTWLAQAPATLPAWSYIWEAAWGQAHHPNTPLRTLANDWMRRADTQSGPSWAFIWGPLWQAAPNDAALAALGREWLQRAPAEHASWAFVWTVLWQAAPNDAALAALGREWLQRAPAEHASWAFVWEALWQAAPNDAALAALGREWLQRAPAEHASWAFVWEALWQAAPNDAALAALAREWLQRAPAEHGSWTFVWEALWQAAPNDAALAALAREWLQRVPAEHASWKFVWTALWQAAPNDAALAALGREWLQRAPAEHASWKFVWTALWQAAPNDAALVELGREWLQRAPAEHGSWAFVWTALWQAAPNDAALAALARAWLQRAPAEHGSWQFVWTALWQAAPNDAVLVALGREWLQRVPAEHASWKFVWTALWQAAPNDAALAALAREWLQRAPAEHGSWQFVWTALWQAAPNDAALAALAREWLQRAPAEHGSWQFVWTALWQAAPNDAALAALAREWLQRAPTEHGSWKFVWEALWQAAPNDAVLAALAREWLQRAPTEHGSWKFVWEALWQAAPNDAVLAALAREWLQRAPTEHGSWAFVWTALWQAAPNDAALAALAREWLQRAPAEHGSWQFVWTALWQAAPNDAALAALAREWLQRAPAEHGSWKFVWEALWQAAPNDAALAALARAWLQRAPAEHASWAFVWTALWQAAPNDAALAALAREWLQRAPAEHGSWKFVWEALWQAAPNDAALAALAREWLQRAPAEHKSWTFVWETLWRAVPDDPVLAQQGQAWLSAPRWRHDMSWGYMWQALWETRAQDQPLLAQGRRWLEETRCRRGGWGRVCANVLPHYAALLSGIFSEETHEGVAASG